MDSEQEEQRRKIQPDFAAGTWYLRETSENKVAVFAGDNLTAIAEIVGLPQRGDQKENARMIIAAPQLYYAAMAALAYLQTNDLGERGKQVAQALIDAISAAAD